MILVSRMILKAKMGIKSLHKLLRKHAEDAYTKIHISEFAFKKVAIDMSLYMCKYKAICGDAWITAIVNLVVCLRENEVHCVFIYDGKAVDEKDEEKQCRCLEREKRENMVMELELALDIYHKTGEISDILIMLYDKIKDKPFQQRLLSNVPQKSGINMKIIEDEIRKKRSQLLNISKSDYDMTREMFDILSIPYFTAPTEAETMCADLCKRGLVHAVLSEDTDVLAYGANILLTEIDPFKHTCVKIEHDILLKSIDLNYESFLDLCIMCGTDYNKNIAGIGPEKAYKLITKHQNIDEIEKNEPIDVSILKHKRVREIFTKHTQANVVIPYCGAPLIHELDTFFEKREIKVNTQRIHTAFTRLFSTIVFE